MALFCQFAHAGWHRQPFQGNRYNHTDQIGYREIIPAMVSCRLGCRINRIGAKAGSGDEKFSFLGVSPGRRGRAFRYKSSPR
jgi:hypothetical protein